jgi:hypothetical protein
MAAAPLQQTPFLNLCGNGTDENSIERFVKLDPKGGGFQTINPVV